MMSDNFTKTVLVVDDDKNTAAAFVEYLGISNFDVLGVGSNGKEAFELYVKLRPEIVFLDVIMPEYDGLYGLEMIKKFDSNAKIIMVTADVSESSRRKMLELGCSVIIYKPVEMDELSAALRKLVEVPVF